MPLVEALSIIDDFAHLGCKAVTITGGGEPLCHAGLGVMIERFHDLGMKIGLVTNGLLLGELPNEILSLVTWCRISNSDQRQFSDTYKALLDSIVSQASIDWAFSHVVSKNPNLREIGRIVEYATQRGFTHVRLVADLLDPATVSLDPLRAYLKGRDALVIYQPRKHYVAAESCWIGYVKPLVAPDFKIYLCCGVQYALDEMTLDLPDELCMGDARHLDCIYDGDPRPFPVSCRRCYYRHYNSVLRSLQSEIKHKEFI
jgi:hypothetical protein